MMAKLYTLIPQLKKKKKTYILTRQLGNHVLVVKTLTQDVLLGKCGFFLFCFHTQNVTLCSSWICSAVKWI